MTRPSDSKKKTKTCRINFAVPVNQKVKLKESVKREMYLGFARKLKKIKENVSDGYSNCNWCARYNH